MVPPRPRSLLALFFGLALLPVFPARAEDRWLDDDKAIMSLVWENDIFANTDQNYTNGFRLSWMSSEDKTPSWARSVARTALPESNGHKRVSIALGQNMYTPEDKTLTTPDPRDRPYAGWLYGSVGVVSELDDRLDTAMLTVGVVGPHAYAKETQRAVHRLINDEIPNGWHSQLHDEPGVVLTMERKWRSLYQFSPLGVGVDATPYAGFNLGNVNTDADVGTMFRIGYDLPADYGPPRIRPSMPGSDYFVPTQKLGGYLFAGVEGRAVGRNIFLDGNSFRDSPSVDKNYWVGSVQAGMAVTYENTRISYTHVFMTKEFKQQDEASQFGAFTVSYRF